MKSYVKAACAAAGVMAGLLMVATPAQARHHQIPEEPVVQPAALNQSTVSMGRSVRHSAGARTIDISSERDRQPRPLRQSSGARSLNDRINDILAGEQQTAVAPVGEMPRISVPQTVSALDDSIIGTPIASQQQCVSYLLSVNPHPYISVTPEQLVSYYYTEGEREGIRPDVAFVQALKETGFFRYGGTVTADQNNYCGLGTTSSQVKGAYFASAQLGVRAHIQHLLAYASTRQPVEPVVDPRYDLVRSTYGENTLGRWEDLNGRWAVPGYSYGQSILSMYRSMLTK